MSVVLHHNNRYTLLFCILIILLLLGCDLSKNQKLSAESYEWAKAHNITNVSACLAKDGDLGVYRATTEEEQQLTAEEAAKLSEGCLKYVYEQSKKSPASEPEEKNNDSDLSEDRPEDFLAGADWAEQHGVTDDLVCKSLTETSAFREGCIAYVQE